MTAICGFGELKTGSFWAALVAEFLGTALLVMLGVGSCIYDASVLQISFGFGIAVGTIVWCIAHISGGHINPAVTAAFAATRKISLIKAAFYITCQCLGATLGAGLLRATLPRNDEYPTNKTLNPLSTLGAPAPDPNLTNFQVFSIESFITFILVLTIFATCDGRRKGFTGYGPYAIGMSVFLGHLWAVNLTGAATNPAGAFGTAVVSGVWNVHWIYWLAPINGGVQAGLLYDLVLAVNSGKEKLKSFFTDRDYDDANFDERGLRIHSGKNSGDDNDDTIDVATKC